MHVSPDLVMDTCLLAGSIILNNGGETYRTEETMTRIAEAAGMDEVNSFVTPTSIILSFRCQGQDHTRMIRTPNRTTNLNKVTLVNEVSRRYVGGSISLSEAYQLLLEIDRMEQLYPKWLKYMAVAVASGSFSMLSGGAFFEFLPTAIAGLTVYVSSEQFEKLVNLKFFTEFASAILGGLISLLLFKMFPQLNISSLLIGALIPLFPGIAITNALRDLMAGDLVAGVSRGVDALLTAVSVAVAAILILSFL